SRRPLRPTGRNVYRDPRPRRTSALHDRCAELLPPGADLRPAIARVVAQHGVGQEAVWPADGRSGARRGGGGGGMGTLLRRVIGTTGRSAADGRHSGSARADPGARDVAGVVAWRPGAPGSCGARVALSPRGGSVQTHRCRALGPPQSSGPRAPRGSRTGAGGYVPVPPRRRVVARFLGAGPAESWPNERPETAPPRSNRR